MTTDVIPGTEKIVKMNFLTFRSFSEFFENFSLFLKIF